MLALLATDLSLTCCDTHVHTHKHACPHTHVHAHTHTHSFGVCSVINLQCPWEHSKCGPGLESSGFSYQPQDLMKEGGRAVLWLCNNVDSLSRSFLPDTSTVNTVPLLNLRPVFVTLV